MRLRFHRLVAACAIAALSPAAIADQFIDSSNPGVVIVNGTAGSDDIYLSSLSDGSILAVRFTLLSVNVAIIDASLVSTSVIAIDGGDGSDYLDAWDVAPSATTEIHGGNGDDVIYGGQGPSFLAGDADNDFIQGQADNDAIFGGPGFKDRLYGGAGLDSLSDEDGVTAAQGGKGIDFIFVNFDAAWDNNAYAFDTRKSLGAIAGGADDDTVSVTVNGSAILFAVDGDGGAGTPGTGDALDVTGPVAPGSAFPNFEFTAFFP